MLGAARITVAVALYTTEFAHVAALQQSEQFSLHPGGQSGSLEPSGSENTEVTGNPGLGGHGADREKGALDVADVRAARGNRSSSAPEEYRDPIPQKETLMDYSKGANGARRLHEDEAMPGDLSTRPANSTCEFQPQPEMPTEAGDPRDGRKSSMDAWISFAQVTARTSVNVNATDLAHRTSAAMVTAMKNSPATVLVLLLALLLFATGLVLCYDACWKPDPKDAEERKSARAEAFPHHAKAESKVPVERSITEHFRLTAANGYTSDGEVSVAGSKTSHRGGRPCPWPEKQGDKAQEG